MKTGVVVVTAAVLSAAGCQLVSKKVSGSATSTSPGATQDGDEGVPAVADSITLDGEGPNPRFLGQFQSDGQLSIEREIGLANCDGYASSRPLTTIHAPEGLQDVLIRAEGRQLASLYAVSEAGQGACVEAERAGTALELRAQNWPAGTYRVHAGALYKGAIDGVLEIEDLTRARSLEWLAAGQPVLSVDAKEARLVTVPLADKLPRMLADERALRRAGMAFASNCYKSSVTRSPLVQLDVSERVTVAMHGRLPAQAELRVLGPLAADGRSGTEQCVAGDGVILEPGTYYLRLGFDQGATAALATFAVRPVDVTPAPTTREREIPAGLEPVLRAAQYHYPFLDPDDIAKSDEIRAALLLDAPPALFVKARSDLDAQVAQPLLKVGVSSSDEGLRGADRPIAFPRAGEPLLLTHFDNDGAVVLAVDASMFAVRQEDLVAAESMGEASWPAEVRNPQTLYAHAVSVAGPEDARLLAERERRLKAWGACADRVWAPVRPRMRRLSDYPEINKRAISRLQMETDNKVDRVCDREAFEAKKAALWEALERSRSKRRAALLEKVQARLAGKL